MNFGLIDVKTLRTLLLYSSEDAQVMKSIEELGELMTAIGRYLHDPLNDPRDRLDNIIEEIADCYIVLTQLAVIFGVANVEEVLSIKMDHVRNLIERKAKGSL
jgi:NTP pyrophosphatase (non-canonical NTP hydrolase)